VLNVASGEKLSINQLFEIVKKTLKSDVEPNYLPERQGDIKHSLADTTKMSKINFNVDSSEFESQLEETINWFKTIL
jgi:UDP-glucose 4-epimerase